MYQEGLSAPDIRMDGFRTNPKLPFTKDELRFITEFKKTEKKFMEYLNKYDPDFAPFSNKLIERMLVDDKTYNIIQNFDEPFSDSSAIPTYYVSLMAREKVKVALTGDGGDEIFFGYNRYKAWKFRNSAPIRLLISLIGQNNAIKLISSVFIIFKPI
jgi:hypothetical protein